MVMNWKMLKTEHFNVENMVRVRKYKMKYNKTCGVMVNKICMTPTGSRSLCQSVTGIDDYCVNQSDYDTTSQEESNPLSTSGKASVSFFELIMIKDEFTP